MNPYEGGDEFINPNTTSTEAQTAGQTVDQDPDEPQDDRAASAVASRLQVLLNQEQRQVNKRLKRGESLESIENWYDGYAHKLGEVIEGLGGDRLIAQNHCIDSLRHVARRPANFDLTGTAELLTEQVLKNV
jgi:hypothetical protein